MRSVSAIFAALTAGVLTVSGAGARAALPDVGAQAAGPAAGTAGRPLPAFTRDALADRYAEQSRMVAGTTLGGPGRQFLTATGGRVVEVIGDLATAGHIAVYVPGADTTPANFDSRGAAAPGGAARALYAQARRTDPASRLAVIAWLGYDTPRTFGLDVLTTGRADEGAQALRALVAQVHDRAAVRPHVSLLCHSYGSVVCGRAARHGDLGVADIAVFGSPGMAVSSARSLGDGTRVWAGRAPRDPMRHVPNVRLFGVGFGADPTGSDFGARRFGTGDGGHGDYLKPGGVSVRNLASIVLGAGSRVTR